MQPTPNSSCLGPIRNGLGYAGQQIRAAGRTLVREVSDCAASIRRGFQSRTEGPSVRERHVVMRSPVAYAAARGGYAETPSSERKSSCSRLGDSSLRTPYARTQSPPPLEFEHTIDGKHLSNVVRFHPSPSQSYGSSSPVGSPLSPIQPPHSPEAATRQQMPALSTVQFAALETVKNWLKANPATRDTAGPSIFRADTPATKAIKGAITEGCRAQFQALLTATIDGAMQDIGRQKAAQHTPFWRRPLELSGAERDRILVRHIDSIFLGAPNGGQVSPMRAAVPQGTVDFLRLLADEVRNWADRDDFNLGDSSVDNLVTGSLILRGVASWDSDVPGAPTSPDRNALKWSLPCMLIALATPRSYTFQPDGAVRNDPATKAAVLQDLAAIKPQFLAVLQSLIR